MNFGIGSAFSKCPGSAFSEGPGLGLGPLYKVCLSFIVFFSLKHENFIMKKLFYNTYEVRCYHFLIAEIIVESVSLIQTSKWEIIITMVEKFLQKSTYQNTEQNKECSCNLYIARNGEFQFIWQKLYSRECQMPYSTWRKWT